MRSELLTTLKPYNTFGIDAKAKKLVILEKPSDVPIAFSKYPDALILGGGSNILLTKPEYDVVLLNRIGGIEVLKEKPDRVIVAAGSGLNWHKLVLWTLEQGYGGLENLSLIPGTTGAAPIQNIGAYGVELKDTFISCEALEIATGKKRTFTKEECNFGYRNSIFKNEEFNLM